MKKELFWDYSMTEPSLTTAEVVMHKPVKREIVMLHDEPWEGDSCGYHNIVAEDGFYRMYYLARKSDGKVKGGLIIPGLACYAESKDGIKWRKPNVGIYSYNGLTENNIIIDDNDDLLDNFFVFKDTNPSTPDSERYKGVAVSYLGSKSGDDVALWCHISSDGIHFKKGWIMTREGHFDSLNTVIWSERDQLYYCFFRGYHENEEGKLIRDIRVMTSKDFKTWENNSVRFKYNTPHDFQMYTNGIFQYPENKDYLVGLATRYTERTQWTDNYDELCGREKRKKIIDMWEPRSGLALTDCILITSRDGYNWHRFDEAFMVPGIEKKDNWVYGDCYPCIGMIETESGEADAPNEMSLYMKEGHHSYKPAPLYRYTIRKDGFASLHAGFEEKKAVTKPFEYNGGELHINFTTSPAGHVYINVLDEAGNAIEGLCSCELFGDALDRYVKLGDRLHELAGSRIRLEFIMSDADIYSFVFKQR